MPNRDVVAFLRSHVASLLDFLGGDYFLAMLVHPVGYPDRIQVFDEWPYGKVTCTDRSFVHLSSCEVG